MYARGAAIAAAALLSWGVPTAAHAAEMPDEPVLMHLKNHAELPLAWTGETVALSADGDRWTFKAVESFQDLGAHLIVHDESGRCLTLVEPYDEADTSGEADATNEAEASDETDATNEAEASDETDATDEAEASDETDTTNEAEASDETETSDEAEESGRTGTSEETEFSEQTEAETPEDGTHKDVKSVPVTLDDCAGATEWTVVFDDAKVNQDYRFITPHGLHLGLQPGAEAVEGAEVFAVKVKSSKHAQEWRFDTPHEEKPPPPSEKPSEPVGTTPVAQPTLPQTGVGMTVVGAVGLTAVGAGAAMALWWRRRSLRGDW